MVARLSYRPVADQSASITVRGDTDAALALERTFHAAIENGKHHLRVDLSGVRSWDATVIEALVRTEPLLRRLDGSVVVTAKPDSALCSALERGGWLNGSGWHQGGRATPVSPQPLSTRDQLLEQRMPCLRLRHPNRLAAQAALG
jgi:anti-anti-sigma regulatory factor